jgi:hypothetical protein
LARAKGELTGFIAIVVPSFYRVMTAVPANDHIIASFKNELADSRVQRGTHRARMCLQEAQGASLGAKLEAH